MNEGIIPIDRLIKRINKKVAINVCGSERNDGIGFARARELSRLSVRSSSIVFISSKMNSRNGLSRRGDTEAAAATRALHPVERSIVAAVLVAR